MNVHPKTIYTIDHGNSHPHVGRFLQGQKELPQSFAPQPLATLQEQMLQEAARGDIHAILLADVGPEHLLLTKLSPWIWNLCSHKKPQHFLSMPFHYADTIGDDRLFQAFYLFQELKKDSTYMTTICIDAGTFLKIDIVTAQEFQGGYIFPGLSTFLASYQNGHRLPLLAPEKLQLEMQTPLLEIPHTTTQAIAGAGVLGLVSLYQFLFSHPSSPLVTLSSPLQVVLTGGDAHWHQQLLQRYHPQLSCQLRPHLIHHALSGIYQYLQSLSTGTQL